MGTDATALRRQSALFLLKMKEKIFLSQAAIDDMVDDTCTIFTRSFEIVKAGVWEKLSEAGIDPSEVNLDGVFTGLTDPFDGLGSGEVFSRKPRISNYSSSSSMFQETSIILW